jgi:hypothetical protein
MKRNLPLLVALFLANSLLCHAEPTFHFSNDSGLPPVKFMDGAEGEISLEADHLTVQTPNFWSLRCQVEGVNINFIGANPEDHLVIEVAAKTSDMGPSLEVVFVNADWSGKAFYRFDLSQAIGDDFVAVKSTTPISEPVQVEGDFSIMHSSVATLQFLTKSERGEGPMEIRLKSLGVEKAE